MWWLCRWLNEVLLWTNQMYIFSESSSLIEDDWELQAWGKELVKDKEDGGVGLLGVPGNGKFSSVEDVVKICRTIVYTCSVSHASANFPQYEEYAFPPNYPSFLRGEPPKDKSPLTEQDILRYLPDKPTTLDVMVVTKILSGRGTKSIGDFEVQYIFDPKARDIVDEFRKDLREVSKKIKERNETRNPQFTYLDPDVIPNSISI